MAGTFEIYQDQRGEFRFRLRAKNGEVVAQSEGCSSKAEAKKGVKAVQKAAADAKIEDLAKG